MKFPSKRQIIIAALRELETLLSEQKVAKKNTSGLEKDISRLKKRLAESIIEEQNGFSDT